MTESAAFDTSINSTADCGINRPLPRLSQHLISQLLERWRSEKRRVWVSYVDFGALGRERKGKGWQWLLGLAERSIRCIRVSCSYKVGNQFIGAALVDIFIDLEFLKL